MLLKTKIFRHLVFFALIPSLAIALVTYFLLVNAIERSGSWLETLSPEKTISSMRITEEQLQKTTETLLLNIDIDMIDNSDSLFDWRIEYKDDSMIYYKTFINSSINIDSILMANKQKAGNIRYIVADKIVIGALVKKKDRKIAAGFIFDQEYLSGFEAASASMREYRGYRNIMPGFILFIFAVGMTVLITVIIIAYFLSRRLSGAITNPLEKLTDFSKSISIGEHPDKILLSGTEEIVNLSAAFNHMMDDLEYSRKQLVAAERVAAWQGIARRMAHELKNPLTPIG